MARALVAAARAETGLPDEEPLHTTAARLLKGLAEEQALSRAQLQDGGEPTDDAAAKNSAPKGPEAGSFFDQFVARGATWADLETHFGGDPDRLPLLKKLTTQVWL